MDNGTSGTRGQPINSRQWTLDLPTDFITGLWHLEGETVSILGDGKVLESQVVVDGTIMLSEPVTRCHVGLPFTARAKTLPLTTQGAVIEGRRKVVNAVAVRLDKTRGMKQGRNLDELYGLGEQAKRLSALPTQMINGIEHTIISTNWDDNGQTYFTQTDPLPVTILSIIAEAEVGDDPE